MIIKKYVTGTGWVNQAPNTTVANIFTSTAYNAADAVFDGSGKIYAKYLPNSVFGGLKFKGTIANADVDTAQELVDLLGAALDGLDDTSQTSVNSLIGMYWIASNTVTDLNVTGQLQDATSGTIYWCVSGYNITYEEGATSFGTADMEAGDWLVITEVSGTGAQNDGYIVRFQIVNNSYQSATNSAAGIVKVFSDTLQSEAANAVTAESARTYGIQKNDAGQLVVNVPWVNSNTTYVIDAIQDSTDAIVRLTDSAAGTDDIKFIAGDNISLTVDETNDTIEIDASHPTITAASSSSNSGRTYIQSLTLDSNGHITGIDTATETVVDTNTTYTISAQDGTTGKKIIRLTAGGSGSGNDDVTLVGGTNVTLTRTGDEITITSANTTYTASDGVVLDGTNIEMVYPLYVAATDPTGTIKSDAIAFIG